MNANELSELLEKASHTIEKLKEEVEYSKERRNCQCRPGYVGRKDSAVRFI